MSQILAMAEKLQESERAVEELREALEKSNRSRDQIPASSRSYSGSVAESSRTALSQSGVYSAELDSETTWHHDAEASTNQASTPDQRLLSDLSVDGNGKVSNDSKARWSQLTNSSSSVTTAQLLLFMLLSQIRETSTTTTSRPSSQQEASCPPAPSSREPGKSSLLATPPCRPAFLARSSPG